jgi:hypothetical protein
MAGSTKGTVAVLKWLSSVMRPHDGSQIMAAIMSIVGNRLQPATAKAASSTGTGSVRG